MNYNQYYERTNRDLKRKILLIILIIVIIVGGFIGYKMFWDKLFNKPNQPLSEYAVERVYTDKDGKVIEKYSYIEIKEKKVDLMKLREWCTEYAMPNKDKYDAFIIKYKGNDEDLGVMMTLDNYITVNCRVVEEKDGHIFYQHQSEEYHVFFDDKDIIKYVYTQKDGVRTCTWNFEKNDWNKLKSNNEVLPF